MVKVTYVPQELEWDDSQSMHDAMVKYGQSLGLDDTEAQLQSTIALSQAQFSDHYSKISSLSGGQKKRLSLSRIFLNDPDLVLLDEPTNHMDWDALEWLHQLLEQAKFAWLLVSHDRYLLDKRCLKIADINSMYRDGIKVYPVSYQKFLTQKQDYINVLSQQQASLGNRVKREIEWLRSGVKARTTKSRSRKDTANALIAELDQLKSRLQHKTANLGFSSSGRKTKQLVSCDSLSFSYSDKIILKDINLMITSGMKLGILGQNGSGKTTLIKLLVGDLDAATGIVERAQQLKIAYFSQNRDNLDSSKSVQENLCDTGGDSVVVAGQSIHVISWAQRFLLSAEHVSRPLSVLSGGEKARVGIAKLMAQQADILLMDEPTNDLDIETVEVLERALQDFSGAVILVSHDRALLDNVCDVFFGLNGRSEGAYFADVTQWQDWLRQSFTSDEYKSHQLSNSKKSGKSNSPPKKSVRLSYKEKYELENMESTIHVAEKKLQAAEASLQDPALMSDPEQLRLVSEQITLAQNEVDSLYSRWEELEAKAQTSET
jgi:ATP-binding cassette subfamily F protein uup